MRELIAFAALYVVEAFIAGVYLEYLFDRKRKIWLYILTFALGYGALFGFSQFDSTIVNAISFAAINFGLIAFNYRCSVKVALIHAAFLCFLVVAGELLVSLVITLFGYSFTEYTHNFSIMLTLIIWSKLLYMVFAAIGALIFSPHKRENTEPGASLLFCILPVGSVIVAATIVYMGMRSGINPVTAVIVAITVASLLVINLLFLSIYTHVQRINREHMALQLALQRDQAEAAHYQALQAQFDNQRILVHDIKNHLHTIDALAVQGNAEEISAYIRKLDASLQAVPQARLCSEPILNILLLRFQETCEKEKISFQCDIREQCLTFMDATDMTTLFSNLLSNAFEASATSQKQQIELSVRRKAEQASVVITLHNSCDQMPETDAEGNFITRKKNQVRHGVGLKSIRRVVHKYDGMETMQYDPQLRQFTHIIRFPDLK